MCSGNDSGNFVMQKTLWCDSWYRQNISSLEIHCQLMLTFGDGVLRPLHLGRGCREFKNWLASIMKITPFRLADQEHENMWTQCRWWDWFWKTIKTWFKIYPVHWSDLWNLYPTLSMYNWDTAMCVHGGYQETWWKFTKMYVCRCSFTSSVI